jgi:hypothetical protein
MSGRYVDSDDHGKATPGEIQELCAAAEHLLEYRRFSDTPYTADMEPEAWERIERALAAYKSAV